MERNYESPMPFSQNGIMDGSDGATTNFGGSPSGQSSTTAYFDASSPGFAAEPRTPRANAYYTQLVPYWNNQQNIPKPIDSFLRRISRSRPPDEKFLMKSVHNL